MKRAVSELHNSRRARRRVVVKWKLEGGSTVIARWRMEERQPASTWKLGVEVEAGMTGGKIMVIRGEVTIVTTGRREMSTGITRGTYTTVIMGGKEIAMTIAREEEITMATEVIREMSAMGTEGGEITMTIERDKGI